MNSDEQHAVVDATTAEVGHRAWQCERCGWQVLDGSIDLAAAECLCGCGRGRWGVVAADTAHAAARASRVAGESIAGAGIDEAAAPLRAVVQVVKGGAAEVVAAIKHPRMVLAQHGGRSADLPGVGRLRFEAEGSVAERATAMRRITACWNLLRFHPIELLEAIEASSEEVSLAAGAVSAAEVRAVGSGPILAIVGSVLRELVRRHVDGEDPEFTPEPPPFVSNALALLDAAHPESTPSGRAETVRAYLWLTCYRDAAHRWIARDLRRQLAEAVLDPPAIVVDPGEPPPGFRAAVSDLLGRVGDTNRSMTDREATDLLWAAIAKGEGGRP